MIDSSIVRDDRIKESEEIDFSFMNDLVNIKIGCDKQQRLQAEIVACISFRATQHGQRCLLLG